MRCKLDFSTLAPVPADFIARYLKKYEGDLIWRVRYGQEKGEWFYIFVLMELQSSVQRFMALRLLGYVIQLCEILLQHGMYLASLVSDLAVKLNLGKEELPRFKTLREMRMSLLQRVETWTQQWLEEGREEGLKEGRLAMAKVLKNLLQSCFGDLPAWAVERIDRADVDTLERWSCRVLDANSLEEVVRDNEVT